jgi:hypothetical protein
VRSLSAWQARAPSCPAHPAPSSHPGACRPGAAPPRGHTRTCRSKAPCQGAPAPTSHTSPSNQGNVCSCCEKRSHGAGEGGSPDGLGGRVQGSPPRRPGSTTNRPQAKEETRRAGARWVGVGLLRPELNLGLNLEFDLHRSFAAWPSNAYEPRRFHPPTCPSRQTSDASATHFRSLGTPMTPPQGGGSML